MAPTNPSGSDASAQTDPRDPEIIALLASSLAADPGAFRFSTLAEARATLPRRLLLRRGVDYEPPPIGPVDDDVLGGVGVRRYRPRSADNGTLIWFHGGGWRLGGIDTHDFMMRRACSELSATVVSVGYRLAPEHRFPAALDDGYAVIAAIRDGEQTLGPLVIGGDSSGGQMAASLALTLASGDGQHQVDGLALMYPALDATMSADTYIRYAEGGGLTTEGLGGAWDALLQGHDPTDPRVSPVLAPDLSGLPPTVILNAEIDPVTGDGVKLHERLLAADVVSKHRIVPGMVHAFMGMDGTVAAANAAVSQFWLDVGQLMASSDN